MRKMTKSICENCNIVFALRLSDKNRGRGRFCGKSCAASGKNNSSYKHGHCRRKLMSKEYRTWAGIIKRTTYPKASNWKWYGGRGITISDSWRNSFEQFLKDVGKAPSEKHEIDRINNNGNYESGNCRWVTHLENMHNR